MNAPLRPVNFAASWSLDAWTCRWNRTFREAFFRQPANHSPEASKTLDGWVEHADGSRWELWADAEDPHCDLEQLASMYDDFSIQRNIDGK